MNRDYRKVTREELVKLLEYYRDKERKQAKEILDLKVDNAVLRTENERYLELELDKMPYES